eukprot:12413057-Karenia_brevis.AAC.1
MIRTQVTTTADTVQWSNSFSYCYYLGDLPPPSHHCHKLLCSGDWPLGATCSLTTLSQTYSSRATGQRTLIRATRPRMIRTQVSPTADPVPWSNLLSYYYDPGDSPHPSLVATTFIFWRLAARNDRSLTTLSQTYSSLATCQRTPFQGDSFVDDPHL